MQKRVTKTDLQTIIDDINRATGSPMEPYAKDETGRFRAQPGAYLLSGAYGGWSLGRIVNESGGESDPLRSGHVSARELKTLLLAFLAGIERGRHV